MTNISLVACPDCQTGNRVPTARLADAPVCGRCKHALFQGAPSALTTSQFDKLLRNTDLPVVVDFWAGWCGPCKMMAPVFAKAATQFEPKMRFIKIDTEAEQALSSRFAIRSIPSLLVFKNGKEVGRQAGAMDAQSLQRWLNTFL